VEVVGAERRCSSCSTSAQAARRKRARAVLHEERGAGPNDRSSARVGHLRNHSAKNVLIPCRHAACTRRSIRKLKAVVHHEQDSLTRITDQVGSRKYNGIIFPGFLEKRSVVSEKMASFELPSKQQRSHCHCAFCLQDQYPSLSRCRLLSRSSEKRARSIRCLGGLLRFAHAGFCTTGPEQDRTLFSERGLCSDRA